MRSTAARRSWWASELWLIGLLAAVGVLTFVVVVSPFLSIDLEIERAIQAIHPSWLDSLTSAVSWLGFPPESTLIDALLVVLIFVTGRRWEAVCAAFAAAGSAGLWFLLAPLVHRPRPTGDLVRVAAEIPFGGFPSGHVLNLTAFFGFLAFLALAVMPRGWLRESCLTVCACLIVAIGFARIYSGEHWPTDVLAGYLLGVVWLRVTIRLYQWRTRRARVTKPPAHSAAA